MSLRQNIRTLEVRMATSKDTIIHLSPTNLGQQTHKSFVFFPKLPLELRIIVWIFARPGPRVLKIFGKVNNGRKRLYSTAKVPALLHTCQESRRIAKERYKLSFTPYKNMYGRNAHIYFDFSSDFVYAKYNEGGPNRYGPAYSIADPYDIHCKDRNKVEKVVYEVPKTSEELIFFSFRYPIASEAILVLEGEGMPKGSAKQSEFSSSTDAFPWQGGQSLEELYHQISRMYPKLHVKVSWNLRSIHKAKFTGIGGA